MNIDQSKMSVSGISSGAAMATQFHFAHSSELLGVGVFAGVPYMCGYGGLAAATTCMSTPALVNVAWLITEANSVAAAGNIDSTANVRGSKVYIFHGSEDSTVRPGSGPNIRQMYQNYGAQIHTEFSIPAEHGQPTDNYGAACGSNSHNSGYINNCGYNGAFEMLNYIHGGNLIRPDSSTRPAGDFQLFDQSEFFSFNPSLSSMDSAGFVYIPTACKNGAQCALHVAFHGCQQYRGSVGDTYATKTGYIEVAELNNIIVLFPQTVATLSNPNGCWDWWGYLNIMFRK
ncbi:unnamed protein product [Orchesella dallaii]|uniref:Poly(3-hydroxyalkanoate) depolymerase C n=1 Tax=Orchesella dallaii TaxID=48710 RepID=A0ABP1RN88_9HEXA